GSRRAPTRTYSRPTACIASSTRPSSTGERRMWPTRGCSRPPCEVVDHQAIGGGEQEDVSAGGDPQFLTDPEPFPYGQQSQGAPLGQRRPIGEDIRGGCAHPRH